MEVIKEVKFCPLSGNEKDLFIFKKEYLWFPLIAFSLILFGFNVKN
jgi:hypothetical protein